MPGEECVQDILGNPASCICETAIAACGDGLVDPGEQCDGADDAICPGLCLPPGDPAECTCGEGCGNGIVELGETCDPPGSAQPPNGSLCRSDCTVCGDGVVQEADGESCDDGNAISGCQLEKPRNPLDACSNSCQLPICDDPARIRLYDELITGKKDLVKTHGRLIMETDIDVGNNDFALKISRRVCSHDSTVLCSTDAKCDALLAGSRCTANDEGSIVFRQFLPAGTMSNPRPVTWKYNNKSAKTEGGIHTLKVKGMMRDRRCAGGPNDSAKCTSGSECLGGACLGYYKFTLKAYGDAERAVADMQTEVSVGTLRWTVRGIWQQLPTGWTLNRKSTFLVPW